MEAPAMGNTIVELKGVSKKYRMGEVQVTMAL